MPPDPQPPQPWNRPGPDWAIRLEHEAAAEIGPGHELTGHALTAIAACSGCDRVVFKVDDGSFAVVHLTWTTHQEPDPWPATHRLSGYIALETVINDHSH
jgi:hypothetical protein